MTQLWLEVGLWEKGLDIGKMNTGTNFNGG
jgi:hypothetical protein